MPETQQAISQHHHQRAPRRRQRRSAAAGRPGAPRRAASMHGAHSNSAHLGMLGSGRLHPARRRPPKGPPGCRPGDRLRHRLPHRALHAASTVFKPRTAPKGSTQHVLLRVRARAETRCKQLAAPIWCQSGSCGLLLRCVARVLGPGAAPCGRAKRALVFPARAGADLTCGDASVSNYLTKKSEKWHVLPSMSLHSELPPTGHRRQWPGNQRSPLPLLGPHRCLLLMLHCPMTIKAQR